MFSPFFAHIKNEEDEGVVLVGGRPVVLPGTQKASSVMNEAAACRNSSRIVLLLLVGIVSPPVTHISMNGLPRCCRKKSSSDSGGAAHIIDRRSRRALLFLPNNRAPAPAAPRLM